jgi:DnaJ-class molecular chaperone
MARKSLAKKYERISEEMRKEEGAQLTRELLKTPEDYERERQIRKRFGGFEQCPECDGTGLEGAGTDAQCSLCDGTGEVLVQPGGGIDLPEH